MGKVKLNQRLDEEVYERLMHLQMLQRISVSDLIANALDAWEREQKMPETVLEQLAGVTEMLSRLDEKLDQASVNEKERLKSLLQLLKSEINSHDDAEKERFERIKPPMF